MWSWEDEDVVTTWYMIQIDPDTNIVDTSDFTFAKSKGHCSHHPENPERVPYASGFGCEAPHTADGHAQVDLTGSPFAVDDTFSHRGWLSIGNADFKNNNQRVELVGGGYCGWIAPSKARDEMAAVMGGKHLQLRLLDPCELHKIAKASTLEKRNEEEKQARRKTEEQKGSTRKAR